MTAIATALVSDATGKERVGKPVFLVQEAVEGSDTSTPQVAPAFAPAGASANYGYSEGPQGSSSTQGSSSRKAKLLEGTYVEDDVTNINVSKRSETRQILVDTDGFERLRSGDSSRTVVSSAESERDTGDIETRPRDPVTQTQSKQNSSVLTAEEMLIM